MRRIGRFLAAGLLAAAVCLTPMCLAVSVAQAATYHWIGAGTGGNTAGLEFTGTYSLFRNMDLGGTLDFLNDGSLKGTVNMIFRQNQTQRF